ncbi:NUDIX domain-containing protein [Halobacillus litoralis]|uniref:NUDIX domain-containing protein n=1 Tax=Halobacillus litoralis TaxID=45668 RepID=UPI00136B0F63|nr:NUDIX domain-containing protein [Halobacillus litoralis]MYL39055.1 hypothetical protein [Halobacillus litoralis]
MEEKEPSNDQKLSELRRIFGNLNFEEDEKKEDTHAGLYIFWSFDLVNSTLYKDKHPSEWPKVFQHFYSISQKEVADSFPKSRVWKYIGDEILFYCKINNKEELYNIPHQTLKIIRSVSTTVKNTFPNSKGILDLKGTLWTAVVSHIPSHSLKDSPGKIVAPSGDIESNIVFSYKLLDSMYFDFLGPDIDLGFRIASYSEKGKLVISADLAYILYKNRVNIEDKNPEMNIEKYVKIVDYVSLKGIWKGRKYPIIWFYDNWGLKENMFEYDEHFESSTINKIISNDFVLPGVERLHKMFMDLDLIERVNRMHDMINEASPPGTSDSEQHLIPEEKKAEVHCAAICFSPDGKVLVGKRPADKKLGGLWEFGCGQIKLDQSFTTCLIESYKEDFGADISVISKNNNPIPVATYDFSKDDRTIPGILFAGIIDNTDDIQQKFNKNKHSEIKFIDPENLETLNDNNYVENVRENITRAYGIYKDQD